MAPVKNVKWTSLLTWALLALLAQKENHAALYGEKKGENTHGDSKSAIHKRMAASLFPENFKGNEAAYGGKVKSKIEGLHRSYKFHLKRLTGTGGGLGGNDDAEEPEKDDEGAEDDSGSEDEGETGSYWVPATGPNTTTPPKIKNMWDDIVHKFEFFPDMHLHLCGRPNAVPPAITTGVGPSGPATVVLQPLSTSQPAPSPGPDDDQDESPPAPAQPNPSRPPLSSVDTNTTGGKCAPRSSSFTLSQTVAQEAKVKIQKTPAKRSFEDRLADATEKSLAESTKRAEATLRIEEKKLILAQLDQLDRRRDAIFKAMDHHLTTPRKSAAKLERLDQEEEDLRRKLEDADPEIEGPAAKRRRTSPVTSDNED